MKYVDIVRTRPGATPVPAGTSVEFRTTQDDVVFQTVQATTGGVITLQADGFPGELKGTVTYPSSGGETRTFETRVTGPSAGAQVGEIELLLNCFESGVVRNDRNALVVSKHATLMKVNVADGSAVVKGLFYGQYSNPLALDIPANSSGATRTDRVVVQVGRTGATFQAGNATFPRKYQTRVVYKTGSTTDTQTADVWEIPLAAVTVPNNATIANVTITDLRAFWETPNAAGLTREPKIDTKRRKNEAPANITSSYVVSPTTAGQNIPELSGSVTLDSGVVYDIEMHGTLWCRGNYASGDDPDDKRIQIALYAGDDGANNVTLNAGTRARWDEAELLYEGTYFPITTHYVRSNVVGTGAAVPYGMKVAISHASRAQTYNDGTLLIIARPRTRQ